MELAAPLAGLRPLPDLLQQPILSIMPGPVFGFLIDNLQHAGKVIEEAGLIVSMVVVLALLGAAAGVAAARFGVPQAGLLAAGVAWLLVVLVALPATGQGLGGLAAGLTTPALWALVFVVYWLVWRLAWARPEDAAGVDRTRRRVLAMAPV